MDTDTATTQASETPQDAWARWQREHADVLARATGPQRILLEAAVRFVAVIAAQPILLRVAAFFLLHAGMGLTPAQVGAAVGRTDRAMRTVQALGARERARLDLGRARATSAAQAAPGARRADRQVSRRPSPMHPARGGRSSSPPSSRSSSTRRRFAGSSMPTASTSCVPTAPLGRRMSRALPDRAHPLRGRLPPPAGRARPEPPSRSARSDEALGSADKARRLVLSLFFRAVLGIERIFHFETLDDPGFAILSGGKKVMSRSRLGGLVRAVKTAGVKKFAQATEGLRALRGEVATLSVDEHVIARFTRKFKIPKGFHTLRNKKMRAEKLSYLYWPKARRFLSLVVSRGNAKLVDLTIDFLRALRRRVRLRQLRVILDAGGLHLQRRPASSRSLPQDRVLDPRPASPGLRQRLEEAASRPLHPPRGARPLSSAPRPRRSRSPRPPPSSRASPVPSAPSSCASAR